MERIAFILATPLTRDLIGVLSIACGVMFSVATFTQRRTLRSYNSLAFGVFLSVNSLAAGVSLVAAGAIRDLATIALALNFLTLGALIAFAKFAK